MKAVMLDACAQSLPSVGRAPLVLEPLMLSGADHSSAILPVGTQPPKGSPVQKPDLTPREHLTAAASAFAVAMGRRFTDGTPSGPGAVGSWFIDRDTEQRTHYRLAERMADGSIRFPMETIALPARTLTIALDFARLAVGIERTGAAAHELGYPYRGAQP